MKIDRILTPPIFSVGTAPFGVLYIDYTIGAWPAYYYSDGGDCNTEPNYMYSLNVAMFEYFEYSLHKFR